ncbi:hypothetical protein PUMCH_001556 [Australozyma saopauloensis]|uniref:Protein FAF1 n=1 Tax=Australozyma saopauloensis TaxID=291208 RepID=A0AAX4H744_9ASCO|nr:hypothetical protein PUMCH_001556 [[Candida] saopauloensis]
MKDDYSDALEIQRRNFERQFGSLASLGFEDKTQAGESEESEDFGGFSGQDSESDSSESELGEGSESGSKSDEDEAIDQIFTVKKSQLVTPRKVTEPKVVRLGGEPSQLHTFNKRDKNLARSGRAPTILELQAKQERIDKLTRKQRQQAAAEDAENVDNDLKLQRLLSESHILAHHAENSGADLTLQTLDYEAPIGNARRRILDHRIRTVLATNSGTGGLPKTLEKMPMSIRKGMIQARDRRVADYEKEAKEAGIVLSKVKKGETRVLDQGRGATLASDRLGSGKKRTNKMRDRGLRINSVGKNTRNGIRISQDEIDRINNQGKKRRKK